jgi:hypothetical protein
MGAHGQSENLGIEFGGREIISALASYAAVSLDAGLDHSDHGEMGKAGFVGVAARGEEPIDVVADGMAAYGVRHEAASCELQTAPFSRLKSSVVQCGCISDFR